jgi:hypothetical protein
LECGRRVPLSEHLDVQGAADRAGRSPAAGDVG